MNPLKSLVQLLLTPLPAVLKTPLYRLLGARIATGAHIAAFTVVVADQIELGPHAVIKALTMIVGLHELRIGAYAMISNLCVINGRSRLVLGPRGVIAPGCLIDVREPVTIGEYSGLGPRCTLMTHGTFWPCAWGYRAKSGPIELEPLVWVTFNCSIGPQVRIASHTFVLPGSGIYGNVPESCVLADSALGRKTFPLAMIRQPVTRAGLQAHWREFLNEYHAAQLAPRGWALEERAPAFVLRSREREIRVDFFTPSGADKPRRGEHWLFGYGADEAVLRNAALGCLDFRSLLYSAHASRMLRDCAAYYRSTRGGRFADFRHRDCFHLELPALED
jgi:acetyltransferase-like isoleucine patch superfamily enzyme